MANQQQNPGVVTNTFNKGMLKDYNETFVGDGLWTHARNLVNNSHDGNVGVVGNEPSNIECVKFPYDLIGTISLGEGKWVVYTTDDTDSEIGIFNENDCTYTKVVNSQCLNFKRSHLILGTSRSKYDCDTLIYWDDGLNPTRTMNIDNPPFKYTEKVVDDCITKTYTTELDCEAIRIAPLMTYPCIKLSKGKVAGTLPNGSYQACIAYTINQVRVSDYIGLSEVQSLFTHENVSSSLEITITDIDEDFDEFELVLVTNINSQAVAKRIGYYNTSQGTIYIDRWDPEYLTVPISDVVFRGQSVEKSDAMYTVTDYLLRIGVYSKFKFNYQVQANNIETKWVAVEYPADYYHKGGNNTGYMRDEQYSFFIRWIYNTGERSESYHIPGRTPNSKDLQNAVAQDVIETGVKLKRWQVENTATYKQVRNYKLADGGNVVAKGEMGYWESTERYPADRPEIWGDLCGKAIRHHKMPDISVNEALNHYGDSGNTIVILGVEFGNITHPLDENGLPIESIVGYEILRGSREGNKSIIGKGLLNNMREYSIPGNTTTTGLYVNYPYNDLRPDSYLTGSEQNGENGPSNGNVSSGKLSGYRQDVFSFHSPETTFSNPFLNAVELKLYQEMYGTSTGRFETPYKHPKFKFPTNFSDKITDIVGTIVEISRIVGTATGAGSTLILQGDADIPLTTDLMSKHRPDALVGQWAGAGSTGGLGITGVIEPSHAVDAAASVTRFAANKTISTTNSVIAIAMLPFTSAATAEQLYRLVLSVIPKRQYAAQYVSHGFYSESEAVPKGNRRKRIIDSGYIGSSVHQFTSQFQINNINRNRTVVLQTSDAIDNPVNSDTSRFTIGEIRAGLYQNISQPICSYYGALKLSIPSQYGQLESIKQLPISECIQPTKADVTVILTSQVFFGGDTYINRFTEKNSMLFFNTWLMGEPDLTEIDYTLHSNIAYPRFWANSNTLGGGLFTLASQRRALDAPGGGTFYVNPGYFYLFNSGVRDFFVESEINVAYRDWEEEISKRHYDTYTFADLSAMFRSDVIRSGNYYKYDYSLSVSKLFNSQITWGELLPRDYDPKIAATCYKYEPNKVIYSLPQQDEGKKDSWRAFLVNNYYNFGDAVTAIKPINKTGALFMMAKGSPLTFMGVEELRLDGTNTKVTIGDGGLFSNDNQLQNIVNTDDAFEYGSCQNKYSVVGTKYGVFWVSQEQGRVFNYAGQLNEVSSNGLKYWFAKYLPSQMLKAFPDYPLYDNPVKGVGVQTVYDSINEIVYISKRDFKPLVNDLRYDADGNFYRRGNTIIELSDTRYFENASWTISYDPKTQTWISFHDWVPTFLIPGKSHFMSVLNDTVWKHNIRCDSYCNFYGVDYPFEIEFVSATGQQVNSMRNIEYLLEVYKYSEDCKNKFHLLDENFDQAIIYNSEQISGLLQLEIKPKNNPFAMLNYPLVAGDAIKIHYSKEENKYRFNQFWDITKDRGEFSGNTTTMFLTQSNGYIYDINPNYVNYSKKPIEHKKFRHNVNRVFLRKTVSDNNKMLFKISNQKLLQSPR